MSKTQTDNLSPLYSYTEGMEWNAVEKVIMERRSTRAFKKEPIPDSMIRRILETGRYAPSAGNFQPWKFVVVKNPEILAAMERDTIKVAKFIMWFVDYSRTPLRRLLLKPYAKFMTRLKPNSMHPIPFVLIQRIAQDKVPVYHGAPTLILLLMDKRGIGNPHLDIGIAGENMVLATHSLGAASCWVGMILLLMYLPKWRKFFGVKYPYELTDCLAIGWPKTKTDGEVPKEAQLVPWYEGGLNDPPRIERQGE
ncbi:MAG: nitroreductase family protein [Ignavibacteriales bacterium]